MAAEGEDKAPLSVDEVAAAGLALVAERDLPGMALRLREALESWCTPSLVVCIQKDASVEGGWSTIAELTWGALSQGIERSLARMIEDAPGSFARPTLVRTEVSAANVRPRDNVVVPWWWGDASGYLVLRSVPRPVPPNLAEAVALVCLPLWPLLRRPPATAAAKAPERRDAQPAPDVSALHNSALHKRIDTLERARATVEMERDRAESEAAELRDRVELLERQIQRVEEERIAFDASREAAARSDASLLAQRLKELEVVRLQLDEIVEKAKALESGRAALEQRADGLASENDALLRQLETLESERPALQQRAETLGSEHGSLLHKLEALESERAALLREREASERQRSDMEGALARTRAETQTLYASIESLQRQLQEEAKRLDGERAAASDKLVALEWTRADADALKTSAELERDEARRAAEEAEDRASQAEARARHVSERWDNSVAYFRAAFDALRRTPFVPPTLRVSMSGAESVLAREEIVAALPAPSGIRVLLLDRDTGGLDVLAAELEAAGLDVLIAHYPEEVGFFLKTPDARRLAAAVCDVMAFRADQEVVEAFRSWRHDLPGLALFLSFKADHPTEAERARRVPSVLAAGYLKRPLQSGPVVEALVALGRRPAART